MANKPSPKKRNANSQLQAVHTEMATYSGPIPPANQLSQYEQVLPGAADRIITMAEKQSQHRQEIEKVSIRTNARNSTLGVWFGFILGILTIAGGVFLAYNGRELSGSLIGSAGLIGLVSVFVYGTRSSRKERLEKK